MLKRFIVLLIVALPFTATAQEKLTLTFKEAVQIAIDNNINLQQQLNNLEGIQARKTASYGSLGPDLSAFGQGWRSKGNFFLEQTAEVINTESDNIFGSLDADITLFGGLGKLNTIKRETHRLDAQTATVFRAEQDVINDMALQYLIVLQDIEQVRIEEENVKNQESLLDQINTMFETGSRPIMDKYNQEYETENAKLGLIRARNNLINDKALLAQIMILEPNTDFELIEPEWSLENLVALDLTLDGMFSDAMQHRRDLESTEKNAEVAKRNLSVQKSLFSPTLSGFYGWSSRATDVVSNRSIQDQFLVDNTRQQYGLRLAIPIYNGLRNRATVANAKIQYQNALLDIKNQQIAVKTEVVQAYRNYQAVLSSYEVSQLQFLAAEKALEVQNESYRLGISNQIDVTRTLRDYVDAQTALSRSKYALLFQRFQLEYVVGTITFEQLPD